MCVCVEVRPIVCVCVGEAHALTTRKMFVCVCVSVRACNLAVFLFTCKMIAFELAKLETYTQLHVKCRVNKYYLNCA